MLETRYISKLGSSVTRPGLGCLPTGLIQRELTPAEGAEVVRAAPANGITFIDAATDELAFKTSLQTKRLDIPEEVYTGCGQCGENCENRALSTIDGKCGVDLDVCILCGYCAPHRQRFAVRFV